MSSSSDIQRTYMYLSKKVNENYCAKW